jgi:hypothetical protein
MDSSTITRRDAVQPNVVYSAKDAPEFHWPDLASEGLYPQNRKSDGAVRNLALAILLQAFRDIVAPKKASNKEWAVWRQDAAEWFLDEEDGPGSLQWVCDILEMHPRQLRQWLKSYRHSNHAAKKEMAKRLVRFQIPH